MAYRIYTYQDPYRIAETDFWPTIRDYPHFCSARTLSRAMIRVLGDEEVRTLICPLDDIIDQQLVYASWSVNISRQIKQYSEIGRLIDSWRKVNQSKQKYPDSYFDALDRSKGSLLDAVRMFIELGIPSKELHVEKLNPEHRIFKAVLESIENEELFKLPKLPALSDFETVLLAQCKDEKADIEEMMEASNNPSQYQSRLKLIDKMETGINNWDGKHVVVHGIHQFSPLQLRFLTEMEKLGMEIIFIFNYQQEFPEIYRSWENIYRLFGTEIHHDQKVEPYHYPLPLIGHAIGKNLGLICGQRTPSKMAQINNNYMIYKDYSDTLLRCYDNISEFAGYVSDGFAVAEKEVYPEGKTRFGKRSTREVLAQMDEVIYTANKEVDDLLQVYHPEYARKRHFLSYPIGQFFVALYALWDAESGEIQIDFNLVHECLNANILSQYNSSNLVNTILNLAPLFDHIKSYSQFEKCFTSYLSNYITVQEAVGNSDLIALRRLIIYNSEKVTQHDIEELLSAVKAINYSAQEIFGKAEKNQRISFAKHFKALQGFICDKQENMMEGEEKDLINQLVIRLDDVTNQMQSMQISGTLDDIRSGLYFFLKEKEKHQSDWFVRNFEQIDGDVLLSKFEKKPDGRNKTYHFACVSDKDMNSRRNDLLPWPLTELFIEKAYNPKDLTFQVFYTAQGERSAFMRYALFYGLFYGCGNVVISYVRHRGDEKTTAYELLKLIGLQEHDWTNPPLSKPLAIKATQERKRVDTLQYDRIQTAEFFLCPYRYFQDYVLKKSPIMTTAFLMERYLVNLLIIQAWRQLAGKRKSEIGKKVKVIVEQACNRLAPFFPFLQGTDLIDDQRQAINYINHKLFENDRIKPYDDHHSELRGLFGKAKFYEDNENLTKTHPFPIMEALTRQEEESKTYSVHSIWDKQKDQYIQAMKDYLNDSADNFPQSGSWCVYCGDRDVCLLPFAENSEESV